LAHGLLILSGGVANVVTDLRTTESSSVVVDLVRLTRYEYSHFHCTKKKTHDTRRVSIVFGNERSGVSRIGLGVDEGNARNGSDGE
jgi:tRNA C32,U32 (ribose-2'-O)-methylase TrmJ